MCTHTRNLTLVFKLLSMYIHRNRHTYSLKQGQQAQEGKHKLVQSAKDAEINMITVTALYT